ncbi:MAG: hypothetical protein ACI9LS_001998 [Flavobacteriales bacterium]|jgi:hypothetical protein
MTNLLTKQRIGWILMLILFIPFLAFGQSTPDAAISSNTNFLESLGLLGGMAIAPFAALFVTSLISVLGLGNEFVAENPILGNWITVVISGVLTFAPLLPKVFKSTAVIGQAIDWINDRAGAVVGIIVLISPYFNEFSQTETVQEVSLGFIDPGASPMLFLTLAIAIPYFVVVMTVRSFFGILIFLSPIPTLDAIFEVVKQGVSVVLILLYLVWPEAALIVTGLVFLFSFFLYQKAKRIMAFFRYLYLHPIIRSLGFGETTLVPSNLPRAVSNEIAPSFAIEVVLKQPFHTWRRRQLVWLTITNGEVKLIQPQWFGMAETISLGSQFTAFNRVERKWSHLLLYSQSHHFQLQLNLTYSPKIDEIETLFRIENESVNNASVPNTKTLLHAFGKAT